jgi:hypothetical protein
VTPPAPTLAALLRLPTVLDFDGVCAALRISPSQGYKLQAAGQFPIAPLPHSGRKRLYPLAEVIRYLGFDPALVAARPAA